MLKKTILVLLATSLMPATSVAGSWPSFGTRVPISGFEASGAVWDTYSGRLILVDDGGNVYSDDGSKIKIGGDLEGIATTGNGYLYAGTEGKCGSEKPTIKELWAPPVRATGRVWTLTDYPVPASCTKGMEGFTWVPNGHHPYGNRSSGGVFYVSSMSEGKVYVFDVNLAFSGGQSTLLNPGGFTPLSGQNDISDLYYDPSQKRLFVLYDEANKLVQVDISKAAPVVVSNIISLPATPSNQEGVTFTPSCTASGTTTIFLADDPSGSGYYSFNGFPGICASDSRRAETLALSTALEVYSSSVIGYNVSVTVRNTGSTAWTGSAFGLYSIGEISSGVSLGSSESVVPGQIKTFSFQIKYPYPGIFKLQWRMKQGGGWFGEPTPEVRVNAKDVKGPCGRCLQEAPVE